VRLAGKLEAQRADVLGDLGIFQDLILVAQPSHDHAADLVLVLQGQHGLRRAANVGQILRVGVAGAPNHDQGRQGGAQQSLEQRKGRHFHSEQCGAGRRGCKALQLRP
jgi:hypothetical protein